MPENQNVEWKVKWKDEYLEWICGYANAQGGKIYIGCNDNGEVVGISNASKLLEDIPNKARDAMGIIVGVNLYVSDGKDYIVINVPAYPIGISCKGVYYYRSGSTKQVLTGPALEAFLMRKRGATWDNLPLPAFSLDDVDDNIVEHFKQWASKKGRIFNTLLNTSILPLICQFFTNLNFLKPLIYPLTGITFFEVCFQCPFDCEFRIYGFLNTFTPHLCKPKLKRLGLW